ADTPEKTKKYIDTIYKKAVDMDRLINDLTFYSNQKLNKIPFNFSKVNLKSFIDDMVEEYQLELENAGIKIESFVDCEDDIKVKADIEKLKRVIGNLIENSKKYNDKPFGKIILNACISGSKAVISIEDSGEGIKEESLPFIFDRFYRADPARNSSKGGSGLGLSIAKQIIEGHGGKIWAESIYGVGTKISFELDVINIDQ
ncbi:MAG TPA: HAMP domain-containing sensor histidine kinase, partial [Clostridia bacterium]